MPDRISFETKVLSSGQHTVTSPDINGFCVVGAPGETRSEVIKQALDVLEVIQRLDDPHPRPSPRVEIRAA